MPHLPPAIRDLCGRVEVRTDLARVHGVVEEDGAEEDRRAVEVVSGGGPSFLDIGGEGLTVARVEWDAVARWRRRTE